MPRLESDEITSELQGVIPGPTFDALQGGDLQVSNAIDIFDENLQKTNYRSR